MMLSSSHLNVELKLEVWGVGDLCVFAGNWRAKSRAEFWRSGIGEGWGCFTVAGLLRQLGHASSSSSG